MTSLPTFDSPVRSVAVLSDVHGVLPALDAALAEPAVAGADLVLVAGDHAAGPQPVAVLDRLVGLGRRAVLVQGNADRDLARIARGEAVAVPDEISSWAAGQLRPDQVDLLDSLPHPVTVPVEGFGPVLFCHGTPRDLDEVVLVDTRMSRWAEAFAALPEDVSTVVCGHTHMPFTRLVNRRLVVNPGSVGMPYGGDGAHWALLEGGRVTLGSSGFDVDVARASIAATCDYPDVDAWTEEYLLSTSSDAEALAAFGPRDGRSAGG
jgi:predicted phosphodiesterase